MGDVAKKKKSKAVEEKPSIIYRDLIPMDIWEKLSSLFSYYVGSAYVDGKSGFVLDYSTEGIENIIKGLHEYEDQLMKNVDTNRFKKPIDVVDIDNGVSVSFCEDVLKEIVREFCITESLDFDIIYKMHSTARKESMSKLYSEIGAIISKQGIDTSFCYVCLGNPLNSKASLIARDTNMNGDVVYSKIEYSNTLLDYWSINDVLKKINKVLQNKLEGDFYMTFEIMGILPKSEGVLLEFYLEQR